MRHYFLSNHVSDVRALVFKTGFVYLLSCQRKTVESALASLFMRFTFHIIILNSNRLPTEASWRGFWKYILITNIGFNHLLMQVANKLQFYMGPIHLPLTNGPSVECF